MSNYSHMYQRGRGKKRRNLEKSVHFYNYGNSKLLLAPAMRMLRSHLWHRLLTWAAGQIWGIQKWFPLRNNLWPEAFFWRNFMVLTHLLSCLIPTTWQSYSALKTSQFWWRLSSRKMGLRKSFCYFAPGWDAICVDGTAASPHFERKSSKPTGRWLP